MIPLPMEQTQEANLQLGQETVQKPRFSSQNLQDASIIFFQCSHCDKMFKFSSFFKLPLNLEAQHSIISQLTVCAFSI